MSKLTLKQIHQEAIKQQQQSITLTQVVSLANGTTAEQRQNQLHAINMKRHDLWQRPDYILSVGLQAANDLSGFRKLGYSDEAAFEEIKAVWNR